MTASERVLFVDDDPPVRTAFGRTLRTHHFEVDLADSAKTALAMAKQQTYAVIATDYRMPDVDGLELVGEMQKVQPNAIFMLVSGECDLELAMAAVNEHHVAFVITKPWNAEELGSMVRRGIEMHQERAWQQAIQQNMVETTRGIEAQKQRLESTLSKLDEQMGDMLLNALELGSGCETRAHCQRVAAYSLILAEALGIRGFEITAIRLGGLLHDIGKIGIPDGILNKPGPLTAEEMNEVRRHPTLGAQMLDGYPRLEEARRLVHQHHERWDGAGYPIGVSGEQINVGARILAVADSLDAMLSDRPYRKGLEMTVAVERIVKEAGAQFDPAVVQAFTRVPALRWLEVRTKYPDAPVVSLPARSAA